MESKIVSPLIQYFHGYLCFLCELLIDKIIPDKNTKVFLDRVK